MKDCAIVLNGVVEAKITESFIICADGGAARLPRGQKPDVIVGDLDSLKSVPAGVEIIRHSAQKNQTDGELCVDFAKERGFEKITFYGALGGRLDHVLGNLALLAYARALNIDAKTKAAGFDIYFAKEERFKLKTEAGDTVSVIPFGGAVEVKNSAGLYYPLCDLKIPPQATRGISNIALSDQAELVIEKGAALIFHYSNNKAND